jgi:trimethylamine:corrinoid methyltransferase-like protein
MGRGGLIGNLYRPLSQRQIETIHRKALDVIEHIGLTFETGLDDMLDMVEEAGCTVDREKARIYFPRKIVEEMVAQAPAEFILCSRDGKNDLHLGSDRVYAGTGGSAVKVPNYASCGLSDSKIPDAQAGWEKAFTTTLAVMGGNNYIHHAAGMLESMLCIAYEQYVMDDEVIGMALKILKGIEVDEEHMAYDAIKDVGPGGNYLISDHTLRFIRNEYFQSNGVSHKLGRQEWETDGSLDARERAKIIAQNILAAPEQPKIPQDIATEIRKKFHVFV